jgi:PhzF family phenazine biosynthesis protein
VGFCGHATVATAAAVADRVGPGRLHLSTGVGPVVVETWIADAHAGATLTSPPASSRPADEVEVAAALGAFGWTVDDLDPRFPPHVAHAGNNHLMLPVRSRSTLAEMDYDYPALAGLMARESWTTVNVFWAESPSAFHARNPFPPGGVVEDPATGAAAAAFGGYLRQIGHLRPPATFTVYQGHDLGAPSELTVQVVPDQPGIRVSGVAVPLPEPAGETAPERA